MNATTMIQEEEKKPVPLESLPPLPQVNEGREREKGLYWNRLLTGDPATVPDELRRKAAAADETQPVAEQNYRLMSNINRSWLVDHSSMSREEVGAAWPELRRRMSRNLGVRDTEDEVYTALSLQNSEEPLRQKVRRIYEQNYRDALQGKERATQPPDSAEDERRIGDNAFRQGALVRQEYLPLAAQVSEAWKMVKSMETTPQWSFLSAVTGMPAMVQAVDALADMEPEERARVYAVAQSLDSSRALEEPPENMGEAMLHSMRRGAADLGHGALQGVGHMGTALVRAAGETLGSDAVRQFSTAADKRLQVLDELRRVAQNELFPVDLGEEAGLAEQMAVDAAGALPGAALAFMGGAGFTALTLAGTGAAVAEARRRAPEGRQELQTAAGILGGALQAGIYMMMSRLGAQMLSRTIRDFQQAGQAGAKGYSLAALKGLGTLSLENAKMLLAGKAAQGAELGMQELAARVDKVASNIDWESFGNSFTDIETNMREAAMNLPYVLIAAGRAALHHFRSPSSLVSNESLLAEWGVDEATRRRILEQPDIHAQNDMLRDALCRSHRWGGSGGVEMLLRSLKLLNTEQHVGFRDDESARSFLFKRSDYQGLARPVTESRDVSRPEVVAQLVETTTGRKTPPPNLEKCMPYLLLMDEWYQQAGGAMLRNPEALAERTQQHYQIVREGHYPLPKEAQLNGLYNPHQESVIRAVFTDAVAEMENLGYRMLMNMESLDSVRRSYKSLNDARNRTDARRHRLNSELCLAVSRWAQGEPRQQVLDDLCEKVGMMYINRRHFARCAPPWLRNEKRESFTNCYERACKRVLHPRKSDSPDLLEAYRIVLGVRACAETMMDSLPHTRDFQDALSMGYAPKDIVIHLLRREFDSRLDLKVWNPPPLQETEPNMHDNRTRMKRYRKGILLYSQLTGYDLEKTPNGKGGKLWRMKRPDGHYTHWFDAPGYAINSLVGNMETSFLPMGKNKLLDAMRRGRHFAHNKQVIYRRGLMFPIRQYEFMGFDHLGNSATRELCAQWLGDATLFRVGLEFAADNKNWVKANGRWIDPNVKLVDGETDRYLVRHQKPMTPLSLMQKSFKTYWGRLITSGWVDAEKVADLLVEQNLLSPVTREQVLEKGRDKQIFVTEYSGPRRRELMAQYPDLILPGDKVGMSARLAEGMAQLNVLHMLAHLEEAPLPDSVKQWFRSTPFISMTVPPEFISRHERFLKANRLAALEVKDLIPQVVQLRQRLGQETPLPFEEYLRAAYHPDAGRRYEQGWCYALGGERTFRAAGQTFWNLLDDPLRAWKLLPQEERAQMQAELAEIWGDRSPEAALQELGEVLRQYPALRAYGMPERGNDALSRMSLDAVRPAGIVEPEYRKTRNKGVYRADFVQKGYTMEKDVALPEECRDDARVLPALRLLSELRRNVVKVPYVDDEGIWWEMKRYGGAEGLRPRHVDEHWSVETGLQPFMDYYTRVAEQADAAGRDGVLEVCGVPLGGIRPGDLDASRLRHVSVYMSNEHPEHMVRLMPGMPDSGNPRQRSPYVVHSADGILLLPTRMARQANEQLEALTPLTRFNSKLDRMYDYDANVPIRQEQLRQMMKRLLNTRTLYVSRWKSGDERQVNNEELFMQIFQDSRLSYFLVRKDPQQLTRGEALASELARRMLLAEYGVDRETHIENLVKFCDGLRASSEDVQLLQAVLNRVVSPYPDQYRDEERSLLQKYTEPDPADHHAELD